MNKNMIHIEYPKNSCQEWLRKKIQSVLDLPDSEFNENVSVKQTGGFYWMFCQQIFTTQEIDRCLPMLEKIFNVKLLWSTSTWGIGIKKNE